MFGHEWIIKINLESILCHHFLKSNQDVYSKIMEHEVWQVSRRHLSQYQRIINDYKTGIIEEDEKRG